MMKNELCGCSYIRKQFTIQCEATFWVVHF